MEQFFQRLRDHARHIEQVMPHCDTEETTKQALILPLLDILGYSPYDPLKVKAEFQADLPGVKRSEKVDYVLFSDGKPVMLIEAKSCKEIVTNHAPQLARYFNATPSVCVAAITNGIEWHFFTDLRHENLMDEEPFFIINFADFQESHARELARFRYGAVTSDGLRAIAKDLTYLAKFKQAVHSCLKGIDPDFVKFLAGKAAPNLRMTQSALESLAPLVKRAVAETMVEMVAGSLNVPHPSSEVSSSVPLTAVESTPVSKDIVDPNNPRIVTTENEQQLADAVLQLLSGMIEPGEVVAKDTESYFTLLHQGKSTRWLLRYNVNRRQPIVQFIMPLTEDYRREIARANLSIGAGDTILLPKPEDIMRLPGLVYDALAYCKDDSNFKRERGEKIAVEKE